MENENTKRCKRRRRNKKLTLELAVAGFSAFCGDETRGEGEGRRKEGLSVLPIRDFLDAFQSLTSAAGPALPSAWEAPSSGFYKVNCDSFMIDKDCACFACIIRNSEGLCFKGCHGELPMNTVLQGELFAIWKGLALAWETGLRKIICESDSLEGVLRLRNTNDAGNAMDRDVTNKILELLSRDWTVSINAALRSANAVADSAAKAAARTKSPYMEWFVPSEEISMHLERDKLAVPIEC
ncbi:hypothetical protein PIB30_039287 [Stylosanthes scabra]|uniref:RNase H type-1 domain-containing protein n=1 Tax=Stylosanthes scabra TaxID=79078 RepID=A0ABU6YBK9_9FABA|nr:hypothetical protein [Stylosanthes scabra]